MSDITLPSDEAIVSGLNRHPQIKRRIAALLAVVEDAGGDIKVADAAEMRLIDEIRRMGQAALQAWADQQVIQTEQAIRDHRSSASGISGHREGKKNSAGTPPSATLA
jgi:hypothetical protein